MHRLRVFLRSLILPVALYCVAGAVATYFVWHGVNGQRGLKAGEEYEQKLAQLRLERDMLKFNRMQWESRIALIKGEKIDADVLDEETRKGLSRVHKNEVVILLPEVDKQKP
ncbi:MAG: septation inhibitor protein [Methylocystis sp.]|nr:MAG: septation inhibitor protein [Methylocystis sp.]